MTNTDIAVSAAPTGPVAAKAVVSPGPAPLGEVTNGVRRTRTTFDEDGEVCSPANPFFRTCRGLRPRAAQARAHSHRAPAANGSVSQHPQPLLNTSKKYRWVATPFLCTRVSTGRHVFSARQVRTASRMPS